jgi:phosphoglycolate phosphatase-like HAD superfamily hydrolase
MKLAVFDIDGTLTLGDGAGTRCFFEAFGEVFGAGRVDARLDGYVESTDCGIAREAAARVLGRPAAGHEIDSFKSAYLAKLEAEVRRRARAYRPVPGADLFLPMLSGTPGWAVAIATGNWRRAAALKLDCARIAPPAVAACSEDGPARPAVLASAVRAASRAEGGVEFERVVYVGDQPWDLRAARELGAAFVGVASDERGRRLAAEGARVAESYADTARFLALLEEAAAGR